LGNHDYRLRPYPLRFRLEVNAPRWPDDVIDIFHDTFGDVFNFSSHNLTAEEANWLQLRHLATQALPAGVSNPESDIFIVNESGEPRLQQLDIKNTDHFPKLLDQLYVDPENPPIGWYIDNINDKTSYVLELGEHRLAVLDTKWDAGLPLTRPSSPESANTYLVDASEGDLGEDAQKITQSSPRQVGFDASAFALLQEALGSAPATGAFMIGMHGPIINAEGSEYPHYFRETEHPTANPREIAAYMERHDESELPGWEAAAGKPYFAQGELDYLLDDGVARLYQELDSQTGRFLRLCLGDDDHRPVDLVLFGHVHRNVEYRVAPVADDLTWTENIVVPDQTSQAMPALAAFGNELHMLHLGESSETIYHSWSEDGSSWNTNVEIPDQTSQAAPALAAFGDELHLLHLGEDSKKIYHSWSTDGRTWTENVVIPDQTSQAAPALAAFGSELHMLHLGEDSKSIYHSWSTDGRTWTDNVTIPDQSSQAPPALTAFGEELHLLHLGEDSKAIYHSWSTDGRTWTENVAIPDQTSRATPALAAIGNVLHMLHLGEDSETIYHSWSTDGRTWTDNVVIPDQTSQATPALASYGEELHMLHLGEDSETIYHSRGEAGILGYFSDFYTENPCTYYPSQKVTEDENGPEVDLEQPVQIHLPAEAVGLGEPVRTETDGDEPFTPWQEQLVLEVPPYADALDAAAMTDGACDWWARHRPLLIQTASLGPIDINQRRDEGVNPHYPGPSFQGFRVIRVGTAAIEKIHYVTLAELRQNGFAMPWEQEMVP
jgi:hypothetical protein